MPAYSFKERFVPMILDGTKRQTIRANRKGRQGHAKPGDTVYLYFGMRTKWCRKLREEVCSMVADVVISMNGQVFVGGFKLQDDQLNAFAWKDGFRPDGSTLEAPGAAFDLMMRFWSSTHSLPFHGKIIYW
jgi:hypothetical protein